jgi:hypothetical protein
MTGEAARARPAGVSPAGRAAAAAG